MGISFDKTSSSPRVDLRAESETAERLLCGAPFAHALFRMAELRPLYLATLRRPVIDLGCGDGLLASAAFATKLDVGLDASPHALRRAEQRGVYRKLIHGDMRCVPVETNTFQTALSISVIEHILQPEETLSEAYRILAPGGAFYATIVTQEMHQLLTVSCLFHLLGIPKLAKTYTKLLDRIFHHVSLRPAETWRACLEGAGFVNVRLRPVIAASTLRIWEALLPLTIPYRIAYTFGRTAILRPPRLNAIWSRRLSAICEPAAIGACIFIEAYKPHAYD